MGWFPPQRSQREAKDPAKTFALQSGPPQVPLKIPVETSKGSEGANRQNCLATQFTIKAVLNPDQSQKWEIKKLRILASPIIDIETSSDLDRISVKANHDKPSENPLNCSDDVETLISDHRAFLRKTCRSYFKQTEDREDLESASVFTAIKRFHTFDREKGLFSTWLAAIVRNEARDIFRKNLKSPMTLASNSAIEAALDSIPSQESNENFELDWEWLIEKVPPVYWKAFRKVALEGESCEVAAKEFGATPGTIRTYIWRARRLIKKLLAEQNLGFERVQREFK